jgi:hypothetical protein
MVIMRAILSKFHGSNPAEDDEFLRAIIRSTTSIVREVKPSVLIMGFYWLKTNPTGMKRHTL